MYSLSGYGKMLADRGRMQAYAAAMEAAIAPGMTVLDIGTGTGIHALLACQLGAKHVWAVEPDPIIHLAQRIAKANGYRDRITFIQGTSTQMDLPEPVDAIVSDLRGVLPLFQQHLPAIVDARTRLLKPGGILIPECDRLFVTLVNAPELYTKHLEPWCEQPLGFDLSAVQPHLINRWIKAELHPEQCITPPQCWVTLDYTQLTSANAQRTVTWEITQPSQAQGLGMWFNTHLTAGVGFSNAPDAPQLLYGQGFFPLQEPLDLQSGDRITVQLRAKLLQGSYTWQWNTEVVRSEQIIQRFRQSTFAGRLNPLNFL